MRLLSGAELAQRAFRKVSGTTVRVRVDVTELAQEALGKVTSGGDWQVLKNGKDRHISHHITSITSHPIKSTPSLPVYPYLSNSLVNT